MPPSALAPNVVSQGLGVTVSSGLVYANGSVYGVLANTLNCVPNNVNFGYLTLSPTVALAINQSGFPTQNCLPIFVAQTGLNYVRNLVDYRPDWMFFSTPGGGGGGSSVVASVTLTGQTASIPLTTLFGTPAAGMYQVSVDVIVTQAGTAGRVSVTIGWNNGTQAQSTTTQAFGLFTLGEQQSLASFFSALNQAITFSTTVTGAAGSPIYQLAIRLTSLG